MTPPPFYKLYKKTGKLVRGGFPKWELLWSWKSIALEMIISLPLYQKSFLLKLDKHQEVAAVNMRKWKFQWTYNALELKIHIIVHQFLKTTYICPSISENTYICPSISENTYIFPQFLNTLANSLMNTPSCWLCMCSVRSSLVANS